MSSPAYLYFELSAKCDPPPFLQGKLSFLLPGLKID